MDKVRQAVLMLNDALGSLHGMTGTSVVSSAVSNDGDSNPNPAGRIVSTDLTRNTQSVNPFSLSSSVSTPSRMVTQSSLGTPCVSNTQRRSSIGATSNSRLDTRNNYSNNVIQDFRYCFSSLPIYICNMSNCVISCISIPTLSIERCPS